jgi:hypothetical protein
LLSTKKPDRGIAWQKYAQVRCSPGGGKRKWERHVLPKTSIQLIIMMKKLTDLKVLFTAVAILEFFYFICGMLPPSLIPSVTGWDLSPDGHWIAKLIGLALGFMGYVAWIFRKTPHLGVAKGLAAYQMASATMDWVMWLALKEEGIFGNALAQSTVVVAIVSHYVLGMLLIIGINQTTSHG